MRSIESVLFAAMAVLTALVLAACGSSLGKRLEQLERDRKWRQRGDHRRLQEPGRRVAYG